ncbi:MAG: TonB-dependent receptor, partial [Opitutaceae bacterium]|nr:TonB-dependent receptor [Opitutaceae bacterium]
MTLASAALAADGTKSFDIPAGDAETTLKLFTRQSGEQILYPPNKVAGVRTNLVRGEMTPAEALRVLLKETDLVAVQDGQTGAYTVQRAVPGKESKNAASRPAGDRAAAGTSGVQIEDGTVRLGTFEVMGSKLLNMDIPRSRDDSQPYVIFDRETISASGTTNLEEFLKLRLTMNSAKSSSSQLSSNTTGNASLVNLRGLGVNQTLILIDGHRTANRSSLGSPLQADLNGIPLGAIERIEVLPTTASAIYGGAATGGVVNVILRRDYAGMEVRLTFNNTFSSDSAQRQAEFSGGLTVEGGKTNLLFAGSYSDANALRVSDRDFLTEHSLQMVNNAGGNFQTLNSGVNPPLGLTTNIRSSTGANLVLKNGTPLNSPITFVPPGYAGSATDGGAAFVPNAGKYNLLPSRDASSNGGRSAYGNVPVVKSFMLTARRQFAPWLQVFVDAFASDNDGRLPINSGFVATTIQPAALNNPFQQPIVVRVPVVGNDSVNRVDIESRRLLGGFLVDLPRGWKAEADYSWSRNRDESYAAPALNTTATADVAGGSVDVLRDVNAFPVDWGRYLFAGPFLSYL